MSEIPEGIFEGNLERITEAVSAWFFKRMLCSVIPKKIF